MFTNNPKQVSENSERPPLNPEMLKDYLQMLKETQDVISRIQQQLTFVSGASGSSRTTLESDVDGLIAALPKLQTTTKKFRAEWHSAKRLGFGSQPPKGKSNNITKLVIFLYVAGMIIGAILLLSLRGA